MAVKKSSKPEKKKEVEPIDISELIAEMELEELVSLKDEVLTLISKKQKEKQKELYANMKEMAQTAGFDSVEEFVDSRKGRSPRSDKGVKLPPKYQNEDGSKTWSGKGRKPRWVVEHLDNDGDLDDLLIE